MNIRQPQDAVSGLNPEGKILVPENKFDTSRDPTGGLFPFKIWRISYALTTPARENAAHMPCGSGESGFTREAFAYWIFLNLNKQNHVIDIEVSVVLPYLEFLYTTPDLSEKWRLCF